MPRLRLTPPFRLQRTSGPSALEDGEGRTLERLDLRTWPGRVRRGPGCVRAANVDKSASNIISAGLFVREDCRTVLVDHGAGGALRAHLGAADTYGCFGTPPASGAIAEDELGIPGGDRPLAFDNFSVDVNGKATGASTAPTGCNLGADPGCVPPAGVLLGNPCAVDADCNFKVGTCVDAICPACPSGMAAFLILTVFCDPTAGPGCVALTTLFAICEP